MTKKKYVLSGGRKINSEDMRYYIKSGTFCLLGNEIWEKIHINNILLNYRPPTLKCKFIKCVDSSGETNHLSKFFYRHFHLYFFDVYVGDGKPIKVVPLTEKEFVLELIKLGK